MSLSFNKWAKGRKAVEDRETPWKRNYFYAVTELWYPVFKATIIHSGLIALFF